MLDEFTTETATARKMLERVPMEKLSWKPHEKSTALGRLAFHVAQLPGMGADILLKEELGFSGGGKPTEITTTAELLSFFDEKVHITREALEATTDEILAQPWKLAFGERKIFEGPRLVAFQTLLLNHFIHHRAQLGVYLRLNDVEIPGSYGPSADEPM